MRSWVIKELADYIETQRLTHPLRIAIDGIDGAGKTTLAGELAAELQARCRMTLQSSIDHFHFPRAHRYRKGSLSPEGYFHDSFDLQSVVNLLLKPLGPEGSRLVMTEIFDHQSNQPVAGDVMAVDPTTIMLFDGVFLQKAELLPYWDVILFVKIGLETSLQRGLLRDSGTMGTPEETRQRYLTRYIPGQQIYLNTCNPEGNAHLVLINDDPARPRIIYNNT